MNLALILIVGIIFLGIIYYFLRSKGGFRQLDQFDDYVNQEEGNDFNSTFVEEEKLPKWFSPIFSNPFRSKKIKQMKKKRKHKVKEQQVANIFAEFGFDTTKMEKTNFHQLKSIVRVHEKRKKGEKWKKQRGEGKPKFKNITHLMKKIEQWEKDKVLPKREIKDVILELKRISGKK